MKVYVASSWRNEQRQQEVVQALRAAGHEVYDFRHPEGEASAGFSWSLVDPAWRAWTPAQYLEALNHPEARKGFRRDMKALLACDACVYVQPCGVSASLEEGFAAGAGKYTVALLAEGCEAELMLGMADFLALSVAGVVQALEDAIQEMECEDCGDEAERRELKRCIHCDLLICHWCQGHTHGHEGSAQEGGAP